MPAPQPFLFLLARSLALLASAALVLLAALLVLGVPGPWAEASAGAALLTLLAVGIAFRENLQARGETFPSARRTPRRTPVPGMPEYAALLAELEKHRRLERELVAAKQAAEAAMMAKGEFLATMSHEIRTPLNGIIPLLDILLTSRLEADQREYVGTAYHSARQLLRIVDDILDYSKLDANKVQLETVGINLKELLEGVLRLMEKNAEAKGLKLALKIDPSVRLAVRGDPVRLRQVLTNLLSNAVKFTERGSVTVSVSRRSETRAQHLLRFEVLDTGIGIESEAAEKLFQPFSQADTSTTRTYGGTGLGLVICRRIIDLMEGRIGVESQPGRGSLFWFEVPLLKAVGDMGGRRRELNGARALLLTSETRMHRRLAIALPNWGLTLVHATTTQEALAKLRAAAGRSESWAFHLLLVDLGSVRNTAVALHRNLQRESAFEDLYTIYLQGDDAPPAELAESERVLFVPRESPENELRQRIARFIEGPMPASGTPVLNLTAPATAAPAAGAAAASAPGHLQGHVLLVEDNPVNRQVAQRLLALAGLSIDMAENGREALERLAAGNYQAVLMDCQMTVMDGYTATRKQREREAAAGGHVPIIAMTANAMVGDREKCLEAGMDDYLSKPLNRALLEETLRRWLATAPGQPEASAVRAAPAAPATPPSSPAATPAARPAVRSAVRPAAARPAAPVAASRPAPPAATPPAGPRAVSPPPTARPPAAVPPVAEHPATPALQMEVIEDLREIMGIEFDGLVRVYLEDAPVAVGRLQKAAVEGDTAALVAPAHSLKSTSANLGAMQLSELARTIEHGARRGDLGAPGPTVQALSAEFARVAAALRALLP